MLLGKSINTGNIYNTKDYSKFTFLLDDMSEERAKRILDNFREHGYTHQSVIIVNKDLQIIDGRARFEACKLLKLPVYYFVKPDGNLIDTFRINRTNGTWDINDYAFLISELLNQNAELQQRVFTEQEVKARREYQKRYREAHKEQAAAAGKKWRAANPEKVQMYSDKQFLKCRDEYMKSWRDRHAEEIKQYNKKFWSKTAEKYDTEQELLAFIG